MQKNCFLGQKEIDLFFFMMRWIYSYQEAVDRGNYKLLFKQQLSKWSREIMISTAVQKGTWVYVYNEKNVQIMTKSGELHGYTATTVSIKKDGWITTYNEKGVQVSTHSAR